MRGDATVVGVGVAASVGWLAGSGLDVSRAGVRCDAFGRASLERVYAVGDPAHRYSGAHGTHVPTGHFQAAAEHADTVARHLTGDPTPIVDPPAYFWSDQFGSRVQVLGDPALASEYVVIGGGIAQRRIAVLYGNGSRLVAGATVGDPRTFLAIRRLFGRGADYPTAITQLAAQRRVAPGRWPDTGCLTSRDANVSLHGLVSDLKGGTGLGVGRVMGRVKATCYASPSWWVRDDPV